MENLIIQDFPELRDPPLVMAFGGWPDAGEGATQAVKHMIRALNATKFAEIDPEEFYDFTQTRPNVMLTQSGARRVQWPTNRFYYWQNEEGERDLALFVGIEPNLRWRAFANLVMEVMRRINSHSIFHMGALLDAVPHTRETRVTGSSNSPQWKSQLETLGAHSSNYEGPTGITSAIMEACNLRGYSYASVWGHAPHYLHATPNFKVSHALLTILNQLLKLPLRIEEMLPKVAAFEREVENVVAQDDQIQAYVKRLEEHFDSVFSRPQGSGEEIPSPEEVLQDLETFLKDQQRFKNGEEELGEDDMPQA